MKKILGAILACLILAGNSFALPVYFKTTKEIKADGENFVELATVDVAKFKQIRVGVVQVGGVISGYGNLIKIEAIEESDLIPVGGYTLNRINIGRSEIIELFSNKIKISARDSGTYKVFIWAQ